MNLVEVLRSRLANAKKVLVVGLGNEFRGDDGLGIYVARKLRKLLRGLNNVKVVIADSGLENVTHVILRYRPTHIVIIDAAYVEGGEPGTIYLFNVDELSDIRSLSTHYIPPKLVIDYIRSYINVDVVVIGVQIKEVGLGSRLSDEVLEASNDLIHALKSSIAEVVK